MGRTATEGKSMKPVLITIEISFFIDLVLRFGLAMRETADENQRPRPFEKLSSLQTSFFCLMIRPSWCFFSSTKYELARNSFGGESAV